MREFTFTVRCTLWTQNTNDHIHHFKRADLIAEARGAAKYEALDKKVPRQLRRVRIEITPLQGPRGPSGDPGAYWPVAKAVVDGLRDAKVLDDDTDTYVSAIELRAAKRVPANRQGLEVTIVEDDGQQV